MDIKSVAKTITAKCGQLNIKVEHIFLVVALLIGMAMAYISPPFQECDGYAHFMRAMDVSYGNVLLPTVDLIHESGEIKVPKNIADVYYVQIESDSGDGQAYCDYMKSIKFSRETMIQADGQGTMSLFYYPQALGLLLGRCLNLSVFGCIYLSKLMNLFLFVALAYHAIKITPILKNVLAVIALFPMTIYQASSQSPDAMLNGLCFLFVGMCLYYAYGDKEHLGWKQALKLGSVLAVIFLCKYVYICLGLLVFLIPAKKFGTKKDYLRCFGIALIPIIILFGFGYFGASSAVGASQASTEEGITQLAYVKQHPAILIQTLISTFVAKFTDYMLWLNVLGSLNYSLGPLIYIVPMFALYVAGNDVNEYCLRVKMKDRVLALLAFGLVSAGIILGIYIGDGRINPVGSIVVQGVQGRYFIAALPALFLVIMPAKIKNQDNKYSYKVMALATFFLIVSVQFLKLHCA